MPLTTQQLTHWRLMPDLGNWGEQAGWHQPNHADSDWHPVQVPFSLAACRDTGLSSYTGVWWCRGDLPPSQGGEVQHWLACDAVHHQPQIWIDGVAIDHPLLPFLPGRIPLPAGARTVAIRLDGQFGPQDLGHPTMGWRHESGLLGPVQMMTTGTAWIDQLVLDAQPSTTGECQGGHLRGSITLGGAPVPGDYCELTIGQQRILLDVGNHAVVAVDLLVPDAPIWSPEQPNLASCTVTLRRGEKVLDREVHQLGFRSISLSDGRIHINGQLASLVGFNYHRDTTEAGMADDPAATRRDLEAMRAAGATFVRLCHYPHPHHTLTCCDELGLLALAEIPLTFWPASNDQDAVESIAPHTAAIATRHLEGLIATQRHHPSIITWSVGNENRENHPQVRQVLADLIERAQHLDPSRPATHVSNHFLHHPSFDADDLICINHYPSWGLHVPRDTAPTESEAVRNEQVRQDWRKALADLRQRYPDKPIVVTEFGYPGIAGIAGGPMGEAMQAEQVAVQAEALEGIAGAAIWIWADHAWAPRPPGKGVLGNLAIAPFGAVSRHRQPKPLRHAIDTIFAILRKHIESPGHATSG